MTDLETLRAHLADRYDIERELGGGGMSRVLRALGTAPGVAFAFVIAGLPTDAPADLFAGIMRAADEQDPFVLMPPLRSSWYDGLRSDPRLPSVSARLGLPPGSATRRESGK